MESVNVILGAGAMTQAIARRKGASTVQIALAWLLAQKPFIVPIPGMDKMEYLPANIGAAEVEMTAADLQEIEQRLFEIPIQGERLHKELLAWSE